MNKTLLLALGGAAIWWYLSNQSTTTAATTTTTGTGTGTTPTTGTTTGSTNTGTTTTGSTTGGTTTATTTSTGSTSNGYNSLAAIYSRLQTAVAAAGAPAQNSPDAYNYYLSQVAGIPNLPAPEDFIPGFTRDASGNGPTYTLAQYWSYMSTYLTSNLGMSGLYGSRPKYFPYGGWVQ